MYPNKAPISDQIRSVAQSCPTLWDPMNRSRPGLPVHHQLLEFTQTHVHRVSDAIQPSHPLSSPSSPAPNPSQHQSLFQWWPITYIYIYIYFFLISLHFLPKFFSFERISEDMSYDPVCISANPFKLISLRPSSQGLVWTLFSLGQSHLISAF